MLVVYSSDNLLFLVRMMEMMSTNQETSKGLYWDFQNQRPGSQDFLKFRVSGSPVNIVIVLWAHKHRTCLPQSTFIH